MPSPLVQVQALEKALTAKLSDPNPLVPLLALARSSSPEVVHKATWALYRVFGALIASNRVGGITGDARTQMATATDSSDSAREVKGWVRDRLLEYAEILAGLLHDSEASLRASGLKLLFALLPPLSAASGVPYHTAYFRLILRALVTPGKSLRGARPAATTSTSGQRWATVEANQDGEAGVLPADVAASAVDDLFAKYDDIRLFFFRELAAFIADNQVEVPSNVMVLVAPLTNLPREAGDINAFFIPHIADAPAGTGRASKKAKKSGNGKKGKKGGDIDELPDWMATYESDSEPEDDLIVGGKRTRTTALGTHAAVHAIKAHVDAYTSLWETLLSTLPLDTNWTRRVLASLHGDRGIFSHWAAQRRVRLADWLGSTVDAGGANAMLAMNGLFVLMTQYNLDYPNFYERLYALLDGNVLHARYRARFFRLLDTFLRSPLLSAALIASFIKRLARRALTAPPAGAILVIPFVYNLFKRHPGTMVMLQRLDDDNTPDAVDPYDETDPRPLTTRALESSVWELAALQSHYLASVSTLAKVFAEQFTKPEFNLEDFLDHGYATLFETEAARKVRSAPSLSAAIELGSEMPPLFPGRGEGVERDAVSELWAF